MLLSYQTPEEKVIKNINNLMVKIINDFDDFIILYSEIPSNYTGFTDIFYRKENVVKKRFSRYGESVISIIDSIILKIDRILLLTSKEKTKNIHYFGSMNRLLKARKIYLRKKSSEFLIACYQMRYADLRIDRSELRYSLSDTINKLKLYIEKSN